MKRRNPPVAAPVDEPVAAPVDEPFAAPEEPVAAPVGELLAPDQVAAADAPHTHSIRVPDWEKFFFMHPEKPIIKTNRLKPDLTPLCSGYDLEYVQGIERALTLQVQTARKGSVNVRTPKLDAMRSSKDGMWIYAPNAVKEHLGTNLNLSDEETLSTKRIARARWVI